MTTQAPEKRIVEFEIVPDEVDGWDVRKADEEQALSNHATRELAEAAARQRGEEEAAEIRVIVNENVVHRMDPEERGVKTAFLALAGLLLAVTVLLVVVSLVGALTGFGA